MATPLLSRRLRAQPADIDDLVQKTYPRAARRSAAEIGHPKAYLLQIALSLFRDGRRREVVRADHRRAVQSDASQIRGATPGLIERKRRRSSSA